MNDAILTFLIPALLVEKVSITVTIPVLHAHPAVRLVQEPQLVSNVPKDMLLFKFQLFPQVLPLILLLTLFISL